MKGSGASEGRKGRVGLRDNIIAEVLELERNSSIEIGRLTGRVTWREREEELMERADNEKQ
jgi:hypothetical protein